MLSTEIASYDIEEKLISTQEKAMLFYDNGTSLESTRLNYNISSGVAEGHDGVKMFGDWGIINSGSFSLDAGGKKIKFFNNPKLIINFL